MYDTQEITETTLTPPATPEKPKEWWRTAEWKKNVGLGRKRSAAKQRRLRKARLAMGGGNMPVKTVKSAPKSPVAPDYFIVRMSRGSMEVVAPIALCPAMIRKLEGK